MYDADIYSALFDTAEDNMKKAGKDLGFTKDIVLTAALSEPCTANMLTLSRERDNDAFLKKAYVAMLGRQVDEPSLKAWQTQYKLPPEDFQRMVVGSIKNSDDFRSSNVRLYSNIYSENNCYGGNISGIGRSGGIPLRERLVKVYRKLPAPVKSVIKTVMGAKR